ncbi:GTP 3',8-cyclase MoaA [Campylobacter insulaenigrae]|uniref:GTP 3',8-cyclase n=1 Tax=Campylobacter insulaenigrae TaxID=260714 RepID=A0ABY3G5G8_9BACT|nr:GTP 3',8-cyclase MoaA [Campylobacter insulaenigrae]MCR6570996.1 GTP 3',8-cyclase MoaA [Campylobacter insulaenigrae]MCR6572584.1 GTP 3',8-cyclase MoaA [Campylobacter insulaenigrae]MCR6573930.1 GTP 3',8-cyclase MoaA [Campylobacter insulaenigrae]MCR6575676.1 GTP 3',8-cyclase MoaA [Campylobacter insulaenigrae]MCR6576958.1 GTP 3',8-cyclase MoaA [Campylobacter insulaenigrae]
MLIDSYGRVIDYLRISVTQRCNFRCLYCMPKTPFEWSAKENLLSFEELFMFVKVCIDEGVNKIRITGGEPLVRKDLHKFIAMISEYKQDIDLALTTNASLLKQQAQELKKAGLKRINISLDTLKEETAFKLAQKNILKEVLSGIEEALKVGFKIKFNTVALKDINDIEFIQLLEFAKERNCQIRFIEFMENYHAYGDLKGLKSEDILNILAKKYSFKACEKLPNAPASLYELDDGYRFGIIDPHSHDFCDTCNRIRLSAEGLLIPCLYYDEALSIKKSIKNKDIQGACEILKTVIKNKSEKNRWNHEDNKSSTRAFYQTGG